MDIETLVDSFLTIPCDLEKYTIAELRSLVPDGVLMLPKSLGRQEINERLTTLRIKAQQFCDLHREQMRLVEIGTIVKAIKREKTEYETDIVLGVSIRFDDTEQQFNLIIELCQSTLLISSKLGQPYVKRFRVSYPDTDFAKDFHPASLDFTDPELIARMKPLLQNLVDQIPDIF